MFRSAIFTTILSLLLPGLLTGCSDDSAAQSSDVATGPAADGAEEAAMMPTIDDVVSAMGLEDVDSLTVSGTAWRVRNSFRQTLTASPPWPERDEISNYVLTIDLNAPSLLATGDTLPGTCFWNRWWRAGISRIYRPVRIAGAGNWKSG